MDYEANSFILSQDPLYLLSFYILLYPPDQINLWRIFMIRINQKLFHYANDHCRMFQTIRYAYNSYDKLHSYTK